MLKTLHRLLAVIGLCVLLAIGYAGIRYYSLWSQIAALDSRALQTYSTVAARLAETGDVAEASSWRLPVETGLNIKDVESTVKYVANEYNIDPVIELPLHRQIEAMRGEAYRFIKIYVLCKPRLAARLVAFNKAYAAHLPCRVSLVEAPDGQLWLYTLNLDLIIHGGRPLPADLKAEVVQMKKIIRAIMRRGAAGEF